jgi:hypothetical protein
MTEKRYYGTWWISDYPDEQVPGVLSFIPFKRARLKLIGSLKYRGSEKEGYAPVLILGDCLHGGRVTLYKCGSQGYFEDGKTGERRVEEFWAHTVFIGAHFPKVEDIHFKRIIVQYHYLTQWANMSGVRQTDSGDADWVIRCDYPESIGFDVTDRWGIFLEPVRYYPNVPLVAQDITIKQQVEARIESVHEMAFEDYLPITNLLQNFLSLAILKPCFPITIAGETASHPVYALGSDEPFDLGGRYSSITISYSTGERLDESESLDDWIVREMLFTLEDVQSHFKEYLQNWFGKYDTLEPIYKIFFGNMYKPGLYSEYAFITSVQALESYHRRVIGNQDVSEEEHKKRVASILEKVEKEKDRKWLEGKLRHSNEPSLRSRLKYIIRDCPENVRQIVGQDNKRQKLFVDRVVATRNYLTHYNPESRKESFNRVDFFTVVRKLQLLLIVCLLKEIGFPKEKIGELIERNRRFHYYFRIEEGGTVTWDEGRIY